MDKIASPQDLQSELRKLEASLTSSDAPSRAVIAAKLNELADRLAANDDDASFKRAKRGLTGIGQSLAIARKATSLPELNGALKQLKERLDHTFSMM